jgi:serine/threonine-protein kinase
VAAPAAAAAAGHAGPPGSTRRPFAPQEKKAGDARPPGGDGPPLGIHPAVPGKGGRWGRRVLIGAGLVVLAIGAVYAYRLTAQDDNASVVGQPTVVPPDGNCVVSYAVWSEDPTRDTFKAQVTVANRDAVPIANWRLWFVMNGDQVISSKLNEGENIPASYSNAKLTQQGTAVTIASDNALTAQRPTTMTISGRYQQSNAAPMAFKLNDKTCETFVSSKPGEPSRPVQHLSNGTTRLGPLPSTSTPVPGVTIDSQGIAQVKPTVKPTTGPTSGGGTVGPTPTLDPNLVHSLPPTTPQFTPPPTTPRNTPPPPPSTADLTTPPTTDSPTPSPQITDTASDPAASNDIMSPPTI